MIRPAPSALTASLCAALALAACSDESQEGSRGATQNIPENQGMRAGTGVGDNAPGGSDAPTPPAMENGATSRPGGAADYPATGRP